MEAKLEIGIRVETPDGDIGRITDILWSHNRKVNLYEVADLSGEHIGTFTSGDLEPAAEPEYSIEIKVNVANNVVIATLYEQHDGEKATPIRHGHGHIIHDGKLGIAQAASYACRRMYESIAGIPHREGRLQP